MNHNSLSKGRIGLPNVGNSCYLNSTIQCLVGTSDLITYFSQVANLPNGSQVRKYQFDLKANKINKNNKTESKKQLVESWFTLMCQLWGDDTSHGKVNPIPFYRMIGKVAKESNSAISISGDQNDFQEFLILLLDSLHDALSYETKMNIIGKDMNNMDKMARMAYENFIKHYENDYSIFVKLFNGQINTTTVGECGHQSNIFDPMKFIPLTVSSSKSSIKLEDLLSKYTSKSHLCETIDDSGEKHDERWFCDKCNKKVNAMTHNTIWDLPKYLIISLGRYQYFPRLAKINTNVKFPLENLDMKMFFSGFKKGSLNYNLYAVANHYGSPHGGHYTAFRKNPDNKWYLFNDSSVSEVSNPEENIVTNGAYCLFYQRND